MLMKFQTNRWNIKEINQDLEFSDAASATQTNECENLSLSQHRRRQETKKKKTTNEDEIDHFNANCRKIKYSFYLRQNHTFDNTIFIGFFTAVCTQSHFHVYNSLPTMDCNVVASLFIVHAFIQFRIGIGIGIGTTKSFESYFMHFKCFFFFIYLILQKAKCNAKTGKSITNNIRTKIEKWMNKNILFPFLWHLVFHIWKNVYAFWIVILFPVALTMCILHFIFHFLFFSPL